MARIITPDVEGFGKTVSTAYAKPIDAFGGAPQVADETALTSLAKALDKGKSYVREAGQKDAAKKKKEKDFRDKAKLKGLAER